jgi:lycopene cyclase domain-containing protein
MSTYLIINILIIFIPLLLSFERNISFYKKIFFLIKSILIVSSSFIIWDVIATKRGDWEFAKEHVIGISFFGLPLEEVLFFITVPYACIFIFETVNFYLKNRTIEINRYLIFFIVLALTSIAFFNNQLNYSFTVMLFTAASVLMIYLFDEQLLKSSNFWITLLITYIPFFIVNYFLTSIPIVKYNESAFSSIRIITIPFEDFFYSFSMISMWILFYNLFKKRNG